MKKTKTALLSLIVLVLLMSSCTLTVTTPEDTMAYVKFTNAVKVEILGGEVEYKVMGLDGLGTTWASEIAYGSQTDVKEVDIHSGEFTISGKIQPTSGGDWTDVEWIFSKEIVAGDTAILILD